MRRLSGPLLMATGVLDLAAPTAAAVAATGFILVAGFQVLLALGVAWGFTAWGGTHDVLPPGLRIASAASAVRRTIESRKPPRAQGYTRTLWEESLWREHESSWADRSTIKKSLLDGGTVLWTFHEDPKPEGEAADPWRTPFFVRCVGGNLPDVVQDTDHVLGSPAAAS